MAEPVARSESEPSAPVDEDELVHAARGGDLKAYDELVKRYRSAFTRRFTT